MLKITLEEMKLPRLVHLESLAKQYLDVPFEVIVKEDVNREGVWITKALIEHTGGKHLDTQHHFSWHVADMKQITAELGDRSVILKMPSGSTLLDGPFRLRPTDFVPRLNGRSPYLIDVVDGKTQLLDRDSRELVANLWDSWSLRPLEYFEKSFEDGTPLTQVLAEYGAVSVFRHCQHWGRDEECKYCDINETARLKKELGELAYIAPKDPQQVAEAAFHLFQLEDWPKKAGSCVRQQRFLHITGGTVTSHLHGMAEHEFYLRYVDAVHERLGGEIDLELQTHPWPLEYEREARRRGVNSRCSNFEVWDPVLFRILCPGKARVIGREEWIRRILDQVDVFGVGHVIPGFVAGVEMAQPWGFKTVEDAVKSSTQGLEFFMSHGVVPRPISWCPEALSALAGQVPPPVDYFIQLDRNWYELYQKYDLPPERYSPIGPGAQAYRNGAAMDMGERIAM